MCCRSTHTTGVTKLDKDWAIEEIDKVLHVTDQTVPDTRGSGIVYFGTVQRGTKTDAAVWRTWWSRPSIASFLGGGTSPAPQIRKTRRLMRNAACRSGVLGRR